MRLAWNVTAQSWKSLIEMCLGSLQRMESYLSSEENFAIFQLGTESIGIIASLEFAHRNHRQHWGKYHECFEDAWRDMEDEFDSEDAGTSMPWSRGGWSSPFVCTDKSTKEKEEKNEEETNDEGKTCQDMASKIMSLWVDGDRALIEIFTSACVQIEKCLNDGHQHTKKKAYSPQEQSSFSRQKLSNKSLQCIPLSLLRHGMRLIVAMSQPK